MGEAATVRTWPGYAAAGTAFAFAAVSLYWVLGGTAGLSSLGGRVEELARARDPQIVALALTSAVVKAGGGVLALGLVQPWGRHLPARPLLAVAWTSAVLLMAYGVLQTTGVALVLAGLVTPSEAPEPSVLVWRLLLWEPWFLLWGVLLGLAARQAGGRPARVRPLH